ncbi:pseudouridine synthase [Paenibacillus sp. MBLB4367]|uniref:pseudouridine synthase n=1 Tax=Paenibacillus sp. MBLB4367 TaxID=3384767 RepID=UPI003908220A
MKKTQRLDKILAHTGFGTRSEIKGLVKRGSVEVNGQTVKDSGMQVDPDRDRITVDGEQAVFREFVYLMLNKPQGVVSATEDTRDRTVIDLLDDAYRHFDIFPVGRLDKDTEGLLLLSNDGKLAHNLLSPKKHVPKTYYAIVEGTAPVGESDAAVFRQGVALDDGYVTMPAELTVLKTDTVQGAARSEIELTIMEGKFHQVKRMFQAVDKKVTFLKRLSMGPLKLDEELPAGSYRELTGAELESLKEGR